jgi:hypothetical protein
MVVQSHTLRDEGARLAAASEWTAGDADRRRRTSVRVARRADDEHAGDRLADASRRGRDEAARLAAEADERLERAAQARRQAARLAGQVARIDDELEALEVALFHQG